MPFNLELALMGWPIRHCGIDAHFVGADMDDAIVIDTHDGMLLRAEPANLTMACGMDAGGLAGWFDLAFAPFLILPHAILQAMITASVKT
jgi:hypothetical protein